MRTLLISLSATTLIGLWAPAQAEETHLLNCRLMTQSTPWLFRQHCKSWVLAITGVLPTTRTSFR
jgi:hypothetical protein